MRRGWTARYNCLRASRLARTSQNRWGFCWVGARPGPEPRQHVLPRACAHPPARARRVANRPICPTGPCSGVPFSPPPPDEHKCVVARVRAASSCGSKAPDARRRRVPVPAPDSHFPPSATHARRTGSANQSDRGSAAPRSPRCRDPGGRHFPTKTSRDLTRRNPPRTHPVRAAQSGMLIRRSGRDLGTTCF